MSAPPNGETVELLQTLIRNACVNEGTEESGQEVRNSDVLQTYLEGAGIDMQSFDAAPGRRTLLAKIEGKFGVLRDKKADLMSRPDDLHDVLKDGARKARESAGPLMERIRTAIGFTGATR